MKKTILFLAAMLCLGNLLHAQLIRPFPVDGSLPADVKPADVHIKRFQSYPLDASAFKAAHNFIPELNSIRQLSSSNALIELPVADGSRKVFFIAAIHVLSDESAREHPEISNYDIASTDGDIKGRITYSPLGMNVLMLTPTGRQYIIPFSKDDATDHAVYAVKDYDVPDKLRVACGVEDTDDPATNAAQKTTNVVLGDCTLRTYRLAVAATGEYTSWAGSQANAISNITTTIANVSLIYEQQLAIKFTLVTNNSIVFSDSTTDPYATVSFPTSAILDTNTIVLNTNIGSSNYDVGFVLNYGWNGGLAYTPAICGSSKGGGSGGLNFSTQSSIMDNLVAHEVGHMFSAKHTMSTGTNAGTCSANVTLSSAYEPGGGSSIMAYAGSVCSGLYYQNYTDGYFHFNSEQAILTYAISQTGCGSQTALANSAPVITVPAASYTIPVSTPFALSATGSDANSADALTYTFDQYDLAATYMTSTPSATATSGPVFRSYPPSSDNYRLFPTLANILDGSTNTWEVLPSVSRTLNFKLLARDNASGGGCVAYESVAVTTNSSAGPFAITSQNTAASFTANGSNTMTVTWDVANTTAAPVSSPNVDILFSTDNGETFPYTLASATANDGTETVLVPNVNTSAGRIKVVSSNNIFFDINNDMVTVSSSCGADGATFTPSATLTAEKGSSTLNQGLSASYGSTVSISGTITSGDPTANLAVGSGSATSCASYTNTFQYKTFTFQPSATGSYTFSRTSGSSFLVFDLYQSSYTPGSPCNNFIISNYIGGSGSSNYSTTLTAGVTYVMAVGTFNSGSPSLPASFTISASGPGGIYDGTPDPGAGYAYTFVIVNNSGNVQGYSATGDMSNGTTYPAGVYTVYGLSYSTSVSQSTLNTYIGNSFSSLQTDLLNSTLCGNLSTNSRVVNVTVPLGLNELSLKAVGKNDDAVLSLQVTNEKDMDHYLVEHSTDGGHYTLIGNIAAANKDRNPVYGFTDAEPESGMNYYRVKAVNFAGETMYSNIAGIMLGQGITATATVFPNPLANGLATVRLNHNMGTVTCRITDISGRVLQQFDTADEQFGIDLHTLVPGIYFLNITGDTERINLRLVRH